jgi:hypothetical protein
MLVFDDDLSPAWGVSDSKVGRRSPAECDAIVTRWLSSTLAKDRLKELCGLREGSNASRYGRPASDFELRSRALDLLRRGELKVVPRTRRGGAGFERSEPAAEPAAPPPASSAPVEQLTWIEFQLVGEDDSPVADVRYRVKLPNGSVREGRTGKSGLIRLEDLDAGKCELTFPDLDQEAWEPA